MKFTIHQTGINLLHQVLNAQGWAEPGLKDLYLGGKTLSELPPAKMLTPTATQQAVDALIAEKVELELDDAAVQTIGKALRAWKGAISPDHYRIMVELKISP